MYSLPSTSQRWEPFARETKMLQGINVGQTCRQRRAFELTPAGSTDCASRKSSMERWRSIAWVRPPPLSVSPATRGAVVMGSPSGEDEPAEFRQVDGELAVLPAVHGDEAELLEPLGLPPATDVVAQEALVHVTLGLEVREGRHGAARVPQGAEDRELGLADDLRVAELQHREVKDAVLRCADCLDAVHEGAREPRAREHLRAANHAPGIVRRHGLLLVPDCHE